MRKRRTIEIARNTEQRKPDQQQQRKPVPSPTPETPYKQVAKAPVNQERRNVKW